MQRLLPFEKEDLNELGEQPVRPRRRRLRRAGPEAGRTTRQRDDPVAAGSADRRGRSAARDQADEEALENAWAKNLDLVVVAAQADPPVARVMDYSKYKYEQEQKAKLARKHQLQVNIKEIKLRPKIGIHDYETKKGHVVRFLKQRAKVKVTIMFRGRETAAPGARTRPADAPRRGHQGDRSDRVRSVARRSEHDDADGPDEDRRRKAQCQKQKTH